jgi:hypothetical protein
VVSASVICTNSVPACIGVSIGAGFGRLTPRLLFGLQNPRLLDYARKVRDRLFVDDRRLRLSRLPDCWQVMAVRMSEDGVPCRIKARTEGVGKSS